jgi:hypothetical protein
MWAVPRDDANRNSNTPGPFVFLLLRRPPVKRNSHSGQIAELLYRTSTKPKYTLLIISYLILLKTAVSHKGPCILAQFGTSVLSAINHKREARQGFDTDVVEVLSASEER